MSVARIINQDNSPRLYVIWSKYKNSNIFEILLQFKMDDFEMLHIVFYNMKHIVF